MIILPDKNIARAKFLMPMLYRDWRPPARWEGREAYVLGVYFLVHASRGGEIVWTGRFEDREDADEFMYSLISGSIHQDRYLQRLSQPMPWSAYRESEFDPALLYERGITYNLVTQIGIGASAGNWGAPADCYGLRGRAGEIADVIGGGGGAAASTSLSNSSGGGGAGWARITSYAMTPGQVFAFNIGGGGGGGAADGYTAQSANGGAGAGSWFISSGVLYSTAGGAGNWVSQGQTTGGAGGVGTAGAIGYTGGRGGYIVQATYSGGAGGGGSSGPNGNGSQGGDSAGAYAATSGGNGNGNQIGPGAAGNWYGPWGPGGGGTAVRPTSIGNGYQGQGQHGGHYGAGGGACCMPAGYPSSTARGGSGGSGILVIQYEPTATVVVTSISPTSGPTAGGQAVSIGGSGFVGISAVNIGGAPVTGFVVNSTANITGTTTAGGAGVYNVNVYGPYSTGVGGSLYTYVSPPTVTGCTPPIGLTLGGTDVTITGTLMSGATSVTFRDIAATSVVVVNATTITCKTPVNTPGLCDIKVTNAYGTAVGTGLFTYLLPASGFNMPMMGI